MMEMLAPPEAPEHADVVQRESENFPHPCNMHHAKKTACHSTPLFLFQSFAESKYWKQETRNNKPG